MKKIIPLLLILIICYSCNKSEKTNNTLTSNQRQIISVFNWVGKNYLEGSDSIEATLQNIENISKTESDRYKAIVIICRGNMSAKSSEYEIATKKFRKAIQLLGNSDRDTLVARCYNGIASCYKSKGDYPNAINNYQNALRIFERIKFVDGIAYVYAGLGQLYLQKNDITLAKKNLETTIKLLKNKKHKHSYLIASHTLANIYGMSGDIESALKIDEEGLRITDSIKSDHFKATFLDNKANCFMYSNQLDSAQYYFDKCLEMDIKTGIDKQIADSYSNLGQLALFKKDFATAEKQALKSLEILKRIDHKPYMAKTYDVLEQLYTEQGDYKKVIDIQKKSFRVYKEMITEKKEASIAEFNVLYETQEKEKQLLESKAETNKKHNQLIIASFTFVGLLLISFLIYRQQKLKHKQQEQEFELKTAISQIENQNKLQEQRLNISRDLHDNIGSQLTFIISSVDNVKYAFDIDNKKLDDKLTNISSFAKETIVELRDTIWAMNSNEITFEDLESRIHNFIEKAKEAKDEIQFSFHTEAELKNQKLTSIEGMNLYRTIQEAVNNAIKYANASMVSIAVKSIGKQIEITIQDNGIGFDETNIPKGNGLKNMQKRMEDIGGNFNLESSNQGTLITLFIS
ncbi:tetratricopeptide repeat protein [Flavobacterium sp.]|uniref:tetratricopeptide repeat-containing sensor histidine kinase n=1 Tax=Flavobacterium sp. TaxID=239 RepID=UPI0032664C46